MTTKAAFRFLTLAGVNDRLDAGPGAVGILCFPLFGVLLGLVLVGVNRVIEPYLPTEILAVLLLTVLILATGGHHLAGTQKTFGALAKKTSITNPGESWPTAALLAVLLIVMFKSRAIEVIGESRAISLLLTPLLARWSLVLFLFGSTPSADDGGARLTASVRSWHLIAASVATLGFALFIAGAQALWIALTLSLFSLFARSYLHRRQGGVSLANCGALIAVSEALSFTLFATF